MSRKRVRATTMVTAMEGNKENIVPNPFEPEFDSCSHSQSLDTSQSNSEALQFLFPRSSQLSSQLLTGNQFFKQQHLRNGTIKHIVLVELMYNQLFNIASFRHFFRSTIVSFCSQYLSMKAREVGKFPGRNRQRSTFLDECYLNPSYKTSVPVTANIHKLQLSPRVHAEFNFTILKSSKLVLSGPTYCTMWTSKTALIPPFTTPTASTSNFSNSSMLCAVPAQTSPPAAAFAIPAY